MTLKLNPHDLVEIIAPASRCTQQVLDDLQGLLHSWGLECIVNKDLFGDDLLCANSDENRFQLLKNALFNPHTKAIICARGGYGSLRLIPQLAKLTPPEKPKIFVGMSDITALHLFLENQWRWPVVHGGLAKDKFNEDTIARARALLFGEPIEALSGAPLNPLAAKNMQIEASITGGNLSLVQASIGTNWQIQGKNKVIFLEEIGERGYRVDRMLEHLRQAGVFNEAKAIVLGDFLDGQEPNGSSLLQPILERFAATSSIPVVQIPGLGHGSTNYPLWFGVKAQLNLSNKITLLFN